MRPEILVLDFGSQYTQLIARRLRELGVYSEILPCTTSAEVIRERAPRGIVLSGGPESVFAEGAPPLPEGLLPSPAPVLGICYGMHLLARDCGGDVRPAERRSYGPAHFARGGQNGSRLLEGLPSSIRAWASHGDIVLSLPPDFLPLGSTEATAIAAFEHADRGLYAIQFHPEVAHTEHGTRILRNFAVHVCQARSDWSPAAHGEQAIARIREQVQGEQVVCGASGGVDSTVTAALVHRAIGSRLHCVFVDNGLLRKDEAEAVRRSFEDGLGIPLRVVDARERFLGRLRGVTDPERKRKIIGAEFIRVFEDATRDMPGLRHLAQGTLYPDVIESVSVRGPSAVIKSHHNVGGLPEVMQLQLVEPLRELFKDEVRELGRELGVPAALLDRHPFPGPGLAVRMLGEVEPEGLQVLREADAVVREEIETSGLHDRIWQAFAVLLPLRAVGVMGDDRTYERVVAVRAVESQDGMTADWSPLPPEVLRRISNRITGEVRGVNRVVYDITSKPPGTIEWE